MKMQRPLETASQNYNDKWFPITEYEKFKKMDFLRNPDLDLRTSRYKNSKTFLLNSKRFFESLLWSSCWLPFIPHGCQTQSRWPWRHHTHSISAEPNCPSWRNLRTDESAARGGCFLKIKWRPPGGVERERRGRRGEKGDHRRAVLRLDLQNKRPRGPVHKSNGVARWSRQGTRDNWIKTVSREPFKRAPRFRWQEVDDLDSKSSWKKQSLWLESTVYPGQEIRKKNFQRTASRRLSISDTRETNLATSPKYFLRTQSFPIQIFSIFFSPFLYFVWNWKNEKNY